MNNPRNTNSESEYFYKTKAELISFCKQYDRIFLYGAGRYGKLCFDFLKTQCINIEGFIVTNKQENKYLGMPIYAVNEIIPLVNSKTGIIFSLKKSFQKVIKYELEKANVKYFEIDDTFFEYYQWMFVLEFFQKIKVEEVVKNFEKPFKNDWRKILVIRLDVIGDMIWTTAFFRELKRNFPKSEVAVVIRRELYSLINECPYIDKIFLYDCSLSELISNQIVERAKSFAQQYLIKEQYDVVFLPRYLPKSSVDIFDNVLLALFSGAKHRIARAGYIEFLEKKICGILEPFFSVVIKHTQAEHEVLRILSLLEACGGKIENKKMELWLKKDETDFAKKLLKRNGNCMPILIAVAPVSNAKERTWDSLNYINLIKKISVKYKTKIKFVLLGGENAAHVGAKIEMSKLDNVCNLINKTTLSQAASVMKYCDMYLGSNTGILHMASAFEKPVIEISAHLCNGNPIGMLSPIRTGAWHVYNEVIKPMGLDDCEDWCKKAYAHCINQTTVEEVQIRLEKMITYIETKQQRT